MKHSAIAPTCVFRATFVGTPLRVITANNQSKTNRNHRGALTTPITGKDLTQLAQNRRSVLSKSMT